MLIRPGCASLAELRSAGGKYEQIGALALKGLTHPVVVYNLAVAASQPALRVIEGGTPSD